jgi:hypothetical protein
MQRDAVMWLLAITLPSIAVLIAEVAGWGDQALYVSAVVIGAIMAGVYGAYELRRPKER